MKKKGISLIILIITIIVLIILTGVVIIGLKSLNINRIEEIVSESEMKTYKEELSTSINDILSKDGDKEKIDINEIEYEKMKKYIPSLKEEYKDKLIILEGELVSSKMRVPTPIIKEGMTPIKWDEKGREIETTVKDPNWYNYDRKKWANAKTKDGSYWVWIPRFAYKITYYPNERTRNEVKIAPKNGYKQLDKVVAYSDARGFVDKEGNLIEKDIERQFKLSGTTEIKFVGIDEHETTDNFIIHPAFSGYRRKTYDNENLQGNFGWDEDIPGFWVAKFEMTKTGEENFKSIPGILTAPDYNLDIYDKRGKYSIETIFNSGINLKNILFGGEDKYDSMNITNTQWGAVAYLTDAIGFYPNGNYSEKETYSGGGKGNNYKGNTHLTTTNNITGIYDINGGAYELVSGIAYDLNYVDSPEFTAIYKNKDTKYVDIYKLPSNDTETYYYANKDKYGDSVFETSAFGNSDESSWYNSFGQKITEGKPTIIRGGGKTRTMYGSGGPFAIYAGDRSGGWRATLVPMK